ncbi:MAG: right-handed parallel beta-helix repeat-containing protein [Nitrososphaerota archaeon]|nr:right-handed parallel beta-helix repeat-containing protein [Nitrososphaerota archaeon]
MQRRNIQSFLLLCSLLFAGFVGAAGALPAGAQSPPQIFVSPAGSDVTGTGSLTAPYATISHAVSVASGGSIIIVEPGTYNEMVNITKRVTIESASSEASLTVVNAIGQTYGIEVIGPAASGTVIEGLTVSHADNHGIFVQDSVDVTIEGNLVANNGLRPSVCPAAPAVPTSPCIEENKAIELVGTSNSTVAANTVINNVADGGIGVADDGHINPGGLSNGTPNPAFGNVITGNTVIGNAGGCGIVVAAYNPGEGVTDNVVSSNYVGNGLPGGIVVAADIPHTSAINNSVIDNTVLNNLIPGIIVHSNTPGDLVSGTRVVGNIVSGNAGFGPKTTGITLIGAISGSAVVTQTIISGNFIHNEFFGVLAANATETAVLSDNSFDHTVTVPVQGAVVSQLSLSSLSGGLSALSGTVGSLSSTVNSTNSQVSTLSIVSYTALGVAIVLGLAAMVLSVRKRG